MQEQNCGLAFFPDLQYGWAMLTVLMECRDEEALLAHTLAALVPGAVEGLVREVIVLDHGSRDGSARVADAAGCRFLTAWNLPDVLRSARGEWLLLLEPGARPQVGWIEEVPEYAAHAGAPARFSAARAFPRPFLQRWKLRAPLELGLLVPKRDATALARPETTLAALAKAAPARRLRSELIPAWVVRERR